jgi:putative PIN family toxin of toxin-antitoxin system
MANKQDRVVIDTNIFISFLISGSFPKIDKLLQTHKIKLLFSNELLNEFLGVVARPKIKKYFPEKDLIKLLENIQNYADFIDVRTSVNICRDTKDNFLLALCADGKADYLITGDEDLLVIKKFKKVSIIKIADYLKNKS